MHDAVDASYAVAVVDDGAVVVLESVHVLLAWHDDGRLALLEPELVPVEFDVDVVAPAVAYP